MTPKEKAKDLFKMYNDIMFVPLNPTQKRQYHDFVKQCALIAVDEILNVLNGFNWTPTIDYWQEVKQQISNL